MIILDKEHNNIGEFSACNRCENYIKEGTCKAFPDEIPQDIAFGDNEHKKKHPKQKNDVVFKDMMDTWQAKKK